MEPKIILYIAFGLAALGLTWLPHARGVRYIGAPIIYVLLAALLFSLPIDLPTLDPIASLLHSQVTEYLTELIVIISLAGAGLAIDCPFHVRKWASTWWLLGIAMPISIGVAAFLGQALFGLPLATSVLLGALLAPTDPVLASSVQVGPPNRGGEDPVRFTLTTEAGLNDGLAFPFVYLALALTEHSSFGGWLVNWVAVDLVYRVVVGTLVGIAVGWGCSHYIFHYSDETNREETQEGLVVIAAIFLAYGLAEVVKGYGFLAVFAAAVAGRQNVEKSSSYHQKPYQFTAQVESILLSLLLLALGGFVATNSIQLFSVRSILFAVLFLFLVRPLSCMLSLKAVPFNRFEKRAIAFLGIRGFGSFYYLAYAQNHGTFEDMGIIWQITTVVVLASLVIHGVTATVTMRYLDKKL